MGTRRRRVPSQVSPCFLEEGASKKAAGFLRVSLLLTIAGFLGRPVTWRTRSRSRKRGAFLRNDALLAVAVFPNELWAS